jgi:hypothetical protein
MRALAESIRARGRAGGVPFRLRGALLVCEYRGRKRL